MGGMMTTWISKQFHQLQSEFRQYREGYTYHQQKDSPV